MKFVTKFLFLVLVAASRVLNAAEERPNVVLILADDLGWADLRCYGADLHETPHLDRFAQDAVKFTQAYAMCVCSPSRSTLMTGKHAARLHYTIWSEGAEQGGPKNRRLRDAEAIFNLPLTEKTIAAHLHEAGYLTALIGKWHLGDWQHYPESHGFDVNIGGTNWGAPQTFWWPYRGNRNFGGEFRYVPHLEFGKPGEYLTDRLTDEAIKVIDRADGKPFFVYLSQHAPHTPIEAKADDIKHFEDKVRAGMNHQHPTYAAMIKNLDENVGRVLQHLQDRGLDRKTVVIFASDNGGYIGQGQSNTPKIPVTSNAPLRSGKGSLYEGGIRIPLMIRWPGVSQAGRVCEEPVVLTDLFYTILEVAHLKPAQNLTDGLSLTPLLRNPDEKLNREALYFHYPHYYATTTPVSAIRTRDWKLLEFFEDQHLELFHLGDDPGENKDLAREFPEQAHELHERLQTWRSSVNASLPNVNPDFNKRTK